MIEHSDKRLHMRSTLVRFMGPSGGSPFKGITACLDLQTRRMTTLSEDITVTIDRIIDEHRKIT
ncbi:MAG: hypothetical protein M2R45_03202 [Verrucomicrobia subdivision 3 bacterium]|nr:hypothetical protein [Limisphaerales bacterium]MCS1413917.1 hypothetical protein [Limisphaerales bacterium]